MQRMFLWVTAFFTLYVSGIACATTDPLPPGDEAPTPHIALLLPLKSSVFGPPAETVQQGFLSAAEREMHVPGVLPVRVYSCFDESNDIAALYHQAIARGARAVVGPLTRNGVNVLAAEPEIPVPTLALNVGDEPDDSPLYFFGMAIETEAREVAQLAMQQNLYQAIVISSNTQLSKRLQFAFEEEWHRSGGTLLGEIEYENDPLVFADVLEMPDTAIFLAVDAKTAQLIRPYLPNKMPIYATSLIFTGNTDSLLNYDLNGIVFVDMPWLLQVDHPAVMVYPRSTAPLTADSERLYALGVDAFRLIQLLLDGKIGTALPLDGVSGRIELHGRTFQRWAIPAIFSEGQARLLNSQAGPSVPVFPDRAAASHE